MQTAFGIRTASQGVTGNIPLGEKRPERQTEHLLPSSAEDKNAWSFTSTSAILLHGMVLWHRDNFIYLFNT